MYRSDNGRARYKLYFFPQRGRGEFIRYILAYLGVPHDLIDVDIASWYTVGKTNTPFGILPVLELENGRCLSQSQAIARYLATKHGLINSDPFENAWGDQLAACIEDIYPTYYTPYVKAVFSNDPDAMASAWHEMKTNAVEPLFEKFEQLREKSRTEWFCGKKLHWSDIAIAEFVDRIECIFEKGLPTKYPNLSEHCKRVHELPGVKDRVEKRPKTYVM